MIISMDDTDSREGMCTTYLCALLIDELKTYGTIKKPPLLVRLNPTIPYKTRGNAAVAFDIETTMPAQVIEHVILRVETLAQLEQEMTNPGVVFIPDESYDMVKNELSGFFLKAVREILQIEDAKQFLTKTGLPYRQWKNGRGLIGALAACGAILNPGWDYTYEYLAYREKSVLGKPRQVDKDSVKRADLKTYPDTWDTVDYTNDLIVCVPHSKDPVMFGIRGNGIKSVMMSAQMINSEPVERYEIYMTNQGTDMHLIQVHNISDIKDMHSYTIEATVATLPYTIKGGHTVFSIQDDYGHHMDCAAYEPTKNFRALIRKILPGDRIRVSGSVKNNTLNIEKLKIISLINKNKTNNPTCSLCSKKMKSAGKGQGFRCKKCGTASNSHEYVEVKRDIETGTYEVPPCARRHLSKPLVRCLDDDDGLMFPSR